MISVRLIPIEAYFIRFFNILEVLGFSGKLRHTEWENGPFLWDLDSNQLNLNLNF